MEANLFLSRTAVPSCLACQTASGMFIHSVRWMVGLVDVSSDVCVHVNQAHAGKLVFRFFPFFLRMCFDTYFIKRKVDTFI
jgi:hypothetical protein